MLYYVIFCWLYGNIYFSSVHFVYVTLFGNIHLQRYWFVICWLSYLFFLVYGFISSITSMGWFCCFVYMCLGVGGYCIRTLVASGCRGGICIVVVCVWKLFCSVLVYFGAMHGCEQVC